MSKKKEKEEKTDNGSVTLDKVMAHTNEQCGEGTMFVGTGLPKDPPRLPTGVFAVDYATGGGLPIWGSTCYWGGDAGGKTSLGLNTVEMAEKICWRCFNLQELCTCSLPALVLRSYWGDVEGTLDRDWGAQIGADPEGYVVGLADYGEQHVNIADNVLRADDVGLVVVDSLGALTPSAEMDQPSEDQFIGLQARMITRMVRKLKQRLIRERKREHPCTVLFTNQLRKKIGQKFGNPETMPGGHGMQHEFSLLIRIVKKAMSADKDAKYIDAKRKKNVGQRHAFSIRKEKVLTLAGSGEFVRMLEDVEDLGLTAGRIDDFTTMMNYAKEYGIVEKKGSQGWRYFNHSSKKQESIKELWKKRPLEAHKTRMEIVKRAKERLRGDEEV